MAFEPWGGLERANPESFRFLFGLAFAAVGRRRFFIQLFYVRRGYSLAAQSNSLMTGMTALAKTLE